jgi:hypothetical protein
MKKRRRGNPRGEARIMTLRQAAVYVGGKTNLTRLRDAGFVRPWKAKHRDVQFDIRDLDAAIDRSKSEG